MFMGQQQPMFYPAAVPQNQNFMYNAQPQMYNYVSHCLLHQTLLKSICDPYTLLLELLTLAHIASV